MIVTTRRAVLAGLGAFAFARPAAAATTIAELETATKGRLGVFALNTGTGKTFEHRPDERFSMASTFKWVLAAATLAKLSLTERITYAPKDLIVHSPATKGRTSLTIEELARAAVVVSDNTAANLLLGKLGGPAALTQYARDHKDSVTRFDRVEPMLNENVAGDPRDTTSPRAMVLLMKSILIDEHPPKLLEWMRACETGKDRLRAGLPSDWVVGDKTGTGERGAVNDVAIATPPGKPPILVAVYASDGTALPKTLAEIASITVTATHM